MQKVGNARIDESCVATPRRQVCPSVEAGTLRHLELALGLEAHAAECGA
jgi:hypothetical protein